MNKSKSKSKKPDKVSYTKDENGTTESKVRCPVCRISAVENCYLCYRPRVLPLKWELSIIV